MQQKNRGFEEDIKYRIKCGWINWRETSAVLCDKKIPLKLKSQIYKTVVRTVTMYGAECQNVINRMIEQ